MRHNTAPLTAIVPTEPGRPVLVVLAGVTKGRRYLLEREEVLLGRSPEADIFVDASDVSRIHARIYQRPGGEIVIEDRNSRNGTTVNNVPICLHVLRPGDRIRIGGQAAFLFAYHSPLEDKLLDAQKMECVGRLAGGMAHDFNNLMATMLADVELLAMLCQDRPQVQNCLANMKQAADRVVTLTNQLLSFAQQVPLDNQRVHLSRLVQEVVDVARQTFDDRISIQSQVDPGLHVFGDPAHLRQMLINLCLNARDAMPRGGELEIRLQPCQVSRAEAGALPPLEPGPHVRLSVRDTGDGMDGETLRSAFDPFFTTKDVGQGTGLGLAAVHGIVSQHGGHVKLDSSPGKGTVATLWLLADGCPHRSNPRTSTRPANPCLGGTVLIGVSSPDEGRQIVQWVESLGLAALLAADGKELLRQYSAHGPAIRLVLLDLGQPELGGDETLTRLRAHDATVQVALLGPADGARGSGSSCRGTGTVLHRPLRLDLLRQLIHGAGTGTGSPVSTN